MTTTTWTAQDKKTVNNKLTTGRTYRITNTLITTT